MFYKGAFSILVVLFCCLQLTPGALANKLPVSVSFLENGNPITTALDVRVSLWDAYDVRSGDVDGSGNINTSALHYGQYQTTFTITPDGDGYFVPKTFGFYRFFAQDLASFPLISPFNAYLQLEYKSQGSPNTSYAIYDFIDDPPYQNVTRFLMDTNSSYYTLEAGPKTSWNTFTLDANNNAPTAVVLKFGETLAKTLTYTLATGRFDLNDDLNISGGLVATGAIDFTAAASFRAPQGANDPGTCSVGGQYYNTTTNVMKVCTAANTWRIVNTFTPVSHLYFSNKTNDTSYNTVGDFIYSGTATEGPITSIRGLLRMESGITSYSARIFDATNSQVIAEVTGQTNTANAMISFGSISNLPSGNAHFKVQMLRVGGTAYVHAEVLQIVH